MPAEASLLLLDGQQMRALLTPQATLAAVREAFVLQSQAQGRLFPVVRERLHTGGVFGIKSGDVADLELLGFKAAGFWPANRARGGEAHQATVLLFDPASGRPLCVLDGNAITTMRTGAAGAWGLRLLARADSRRLCVFGTGVQARIQLEFALAELPQLEEVCYLTADGRPDAAFEAQFAPRCRTVHAVDADAAVAASDVLVTATPGAAPLFAAGAVRPGTHINAVGTDTRGKRELPDGLLARARVVADDRAQARAIGELQWADGVACTEIGQWLGAVPAPARDPQEITVFDMTGLALQDLLVARDVHARAAAQGLGTRVAWPW